MANTAEDSHEVMDGNLWMLAHNFVLVIHVSGGEVNEDINDEHDVNCNLVAIKQVTSDMHCQPNKSIITMGSEP